QPPPDRPAARRVPLPLDHRGRRRIKQRLLILVGFSLAHQMRPFRSRILRSASGQCCCPNFQAAPTLGKVRHSITFSPRQTVRYADATPTTSTSRYTRSFIASPFHFEEKPARYLRGENPVPNGTGFTRPVSPEASTT